MDEEKIKQLLTQWRNEAAAMQAEADSKKNVCEYRRAISLEYQAKYLMSKVSEVERILTDG